MNLEELDRKVAKELLGIRCLPRKMEHKNTDGKIPTGYRLEWPHGQSVARDTGFYGWGWHKTQKDAWSACPRFSTDINAAWIVWEQLAKHYQYFRHFVGALGRQDSGNDLVNSLMKLTPKTICKTALAVMQKARKVGAG